MLRYRRSRLLAVDPWLVAILCLSLALCVVGMTWGLPYTESWNGDDIAPFKPLQVMHYAGFSWHKYPYLHWWISLALYAPWLLAWTLAGTFDPTCFPRPDAGCFSDPIGQLATLIRLSRLLSVGMALGFVVGVYRLALEVGGGLSPPRALTLGAARWSATIAAVSYAVVFYAHTGNLDGPVAFWLVWSTVAFLVILRTGTQRAWFLFALATGAAIATKESVVGWYIGLAIVLIGYLFAGARRTEKPAGIAVRFLALVRNALGPAAIAILFYAFVQNVVFNPEGFIEHWRQWMPGSERMSGFRSDHIGLPALLAESARNTAAALGFGPLLLAGIGLATAPLFNRRLLVLLAPFTTYFLVAIVIPGYSPVRFSLPLVPMLAVAAGFLTQRLWTWDWSADTFSPGAFGGNLSSSGARDEGNTVGREIPVADDVPRRPLNGTQVAWPQLLARTLVISAIALSALSTFNHDLLMRRDSRYAAEAWLGEATGPDVDVAAFGAARYLPRFEVLGLSVDRLPDEDFDVSALEARHPAILVLSSNHYGRFRRGERKNFLSSLLRGESGYRPVWECRSRAPFEPWLSVETKAGAVNPCVVILKRESAGADAAALSIPSTCKPCRLIDDDVPRFLYRRGEMPPGAVALRE